MLRKKAEHAKALLGAGRSIDETVEAGGFADASHLNRLLKKIFGVTANKLRAASAKFHKSSPIEDGVTITGQGVIFTGVPVSPQGSLNPI